VFLYHDFCIHSSTDSITWLFSIQILTTVNSGSMNMGLQMSCWHSDFISFRYVFRSEIARSYNSSIFSSSWELLAAFSNGCTNLHSHQQCKKLFSLHPHQSSSSVFFIMVILFSRCEVIPHCGFYATFLWAFFHMPNSHL
jgi:hypothetical protein